jgi:Bacterial Ig domain
MANHRAVQAPSTGARRRVFAPVLVVVGALFWAPAASAVNPPDISASTLTCTDTDGGAVRSGDDLSCALTAVMAADTENANISATVTLPGEAEFVSAAPPATYDESTRVITFGENSLGFTFTTKSRTVEFDVVVGPGLSAGTAISLTGHVVAVGDVDGATATADVTSPDVVVSPLVADITGSTVGCVDSNGGRLLPGEAVNCSLQVTNPTGHEDATGVTGSIAVGGASWLFGGTSTSPTTATFGTTALGAVASGDSKTVSANFLVSSTALGGDLVTVSSFVTGLSTPSSFPLFLIRNGTSLVVSPGPADLSFSTLTCEDTDAGLLLPGDDLTCSVNVTPLAGHEDVQGTSATIVIPALSQYVSGADTHDVTSLTIGPGSLGDISAGTTKSAPFHLKVASGAPVGAQLHPTGTVAATSIPLGGPVTHELNGQYLIVGSKVVPLGETPEVPATQPPITVRPQTPAASYKLKAKTIRIKLRRGHRYKNRYWRGGRRSFVYVKKYVTRSPKGTKVIKKVTVPKKGKNAPKRGTVKIKGTRLTYTLKRGKQAKDRFRYTVRDAAGKKATGIVIVSRQKAKKKA